jgi:calcium binding protein 39
LATTEADPIPEQVVLLSQEIYTSDLLQILSLNLYRFEFEAKKDFTSIFNTLLRRQVGETRYPTVEYLAQKGEILLVLTKGYCTSIAAFVDDFRIGMRIMKSP